eukprot:jgi/Astpho2/1049/gw1.00017.35.1_t
MPPSSSSVKRDPSLQGKPVGVVQYNPFGDLRTIRPDEDRKFAHSNGSLIAVSYEARAKGVKRNMRGDAARRACPDMILVQVPTAHGKADLTIYREAGKQVLDILGTVAICERASIDECYLDLTEEAHRRLAAAGGSPLLPVNPEQVHVARLVSCGSWASTTAEWWQRPAEAWQPGERLLACGAVAVADLRAAVAAQLGYSCSAGVAHNKILSKLASGLHKPSQQTLVPASAIPELLQDLPIPKLRQLGGKFGEELQMPAPCDAPGRVAAGQLAALPIPRLETRFNEADAQWLYKLARGCDTEEIKQRTLPKSLSCGKTFRSQTALTKIDDVHHWLAELGKELAERVGEDRKAHARLPQLLTVSIWTHPGSNPKEWQGSGSVSRSCALRRPEAGVIADDATQLVKRWAADQARWQITAMFIAAANFVA